MQLARSSAEQDLAIEKQWRVSLQMEIQREKDRVVELTNECKKVKTLKKVREGVWSVGRWRGEWGREVREGGCRGEIGESRGGEGWKAEGVFAFTCCASLPF